jgi:hypothetical protein
MLEIVNLVDANPKSQRNLILKLERDIIQLRSRLSQIDQRLAAIAQAHLSPIPGSAEKPFERAQRVMADRVKFEWFIDRPELPFAEAQLPDAAIAALEQARKRVGADLIYLVSVPTS